MMDIKNCEGRYRRGDEGNREGRNGEQRHHGKEVEVVRGDLTGTEVGINLRYQ